MALTEEQRKQLQTDYSREMAALVDARIREKEAAHEPLEWTDKDTTDITVMWEQSKSVDEQRVLATALIKDHADWVTKLTKAVASRKIMNLTASNIPAFDQEDDPHYFGPKDPKNTKLLNPRLSASEEVPPQTVKLRSYEPPSSSELGDSYFTHPLFDKEITELGKYIHDLEALEVKNKLSKGVNFLGIQFKSDQVKKLQEAKGMYRLLENARDISPHRLILLHNRITHAIEANRKYTGPKKLHGTGRVEPIYERILAKVEEYQAQAAAKKGPDTPRDKGGPGGPP